MRAIKNIAIAPTAVRVRRWDSVWKQMLQSRVTEALALLTALACLAIPLQSLAADMTLNPNTSEVSVDDEFEVVVRIEAGSESVDGGEVHLNFDPAVLEVVSLTQGTALSIDLAAPVYDNVAGTIDYAAAQFAPFPTGTFDLLTITFRAIAPGSSDLAYVFEGVSRTTNITGGGDSILVDAIDGTVNVTGSSDPTIVAYRINVGGPQLEAADASSPEWRLDTATDPAPFLIAGGENFFSSPGGSAYSPVVATDPSIPPGAPSAIFATERWDPADAPEMLWQLPVVAGSEVEVRLYFAELFNGIDAANERLINVSIEGAIPAVFDAIDQFDTAGPAGGFMRSHTLTMTDSVLDIEFIHNVENPALKGIEILSSVPVTDATPPVITLLGLNPIELFVGTPYVEPGAKAIDDRDGDISDSFVITGLVDVNTPGMYVVSYNVSDAGGNAAVTVTRTVDVVGDTTAPIFNPYTPPAPVEATGPDGAIVTFALPTANDDIDPSPNVTCDADSGDLFPIDESIVTCTATDATGNFSTTDFIVTVVDTTPPEIVLVGDNPLNLLIGEAYVEQGATATDIVDGDLTDEIVIDASAVNTATEGTYVVTYNVVDGANNSATQVTRTVIVAAELDETEPVITLLGDNPFQVIAGQPYVDPGATALDDVDGDISGLIVVDESEVDILAAGSYLVTYNVSDQAGNDADEVTRTVNVVLPPTGTVLYRVNNGGPQVAAADSSSPDWSADTGASPSPFVTLGTCGQCNQTFTTGDSINLSDPSVAGGPAPQSVFQSERWDHADAPEMLWDFAIPEGLEVEVRLYFAETFLNASSARVFDVSVEGFVPPVFDNIDIYAAVGHDTGLVLSYATAVTDRNLDIDFFHGVDNPAVKGIEIVSTTIVPNTAPEVTIDAPLDGSTFTQGAPIVFSGSATDIEDNDSTLSNNIVWTSDIAGEIGSGASLSTSVLSTGTHTITADVTDSGGLPAPQESISITVEALPTAGTVLYRVNNGGTAIAAADASLPGWSADTSTSPSLYVSASDLGNTFSNVSAINGVPLGAAPEALFQFERYDLAVLPAMQWAFPVAAGSEVEVRLYFAEIFGGIPGAGERVFDVQVEGATPAVFDDIDVFEQSGGTFNSMVLRHTLVMGDVDDGSPGTLNLTFVHGVENPAIKGIEIIELAPPPDTTPPVITLLGANPQEIIAGSAYVELGATALDDVDGDISASIVIDASAVNVNVVDSYTVTYNVSDAAGNSAVEVSRTVNVLAPVDTTDPIFDPYTPPEPEEATGPAGAVVEFPPPTATDDTDPEPLIACVPQSGSLFALGVTPVNCTATDASGNIGMTSFDVTVEDTTPPVITLQGDNPLSLTVGDSYSEPGATATDLVDGDRTAFIVINSSAVDTGTEGNYVVTYNVSDIANNAATEVTRTVNVAAEPDQTAPVITLLGDNPLTLVIGSPFVDPGATASDDVDGDITDDIVVDDSLLDTDTLGTYGVSYNVSDAASNAATPVTRTVEVVALSMSVVPALTNAATGETFSVTIQIEAGGRTIDGGEVHLNFDASLLQVNNLTPGTGLPTGLEGPSSDNTLGTIDYATGAFSAFPSGTIDLLTVEFLAIDANAPGSTPLTFAMDFPRNTQVASAGQVLPLDTNIGEVSIAIGNDTKPDVTITAPTDGSTFTQGTAINFTGTALDAQDGNISGDIEWESSLDGMLDSGASITETLSLGVHTITAYVTDSGGLPGTASISVEVTPPPLAPSAFIQVNAGQGLDASTFGDNSFVITNTGETEITSFSLDISTTFMPDIVFDPVGSAGDSLGKCLTPGTGTGATGFVAPANACTDPFSQPHEGDAADGYDVISMSFTDFDPGESFAFSVDIDPTSIKNDVTTGDAGSVSGFELIGATASVSFGAAGTIDASLRDEGTLGGSAAVVALNAPATPALEIVGIATPAAVAGASHTIQITGPANTPFTLLQVDARLFIDAGAPGGGFDIDAFEANQALAKVLVSGTIGAGGTVDVPVTLLQTPQGSGPDGGLNHFIAWIPGGLVDGELQTSLTSNTEILEFDPTLPNSPPVVEITAPADGSNFSDSDIVAFTATASDDHDGNIASQIEWSSSLDGSLGTGASVNTSLTGGTHTITAQVMDSGSLVGSDTITLNVSGNAAPVVNITAPADGANFAPGETITFIGSASDAEDGILTGMLSWTSDLDGLLGTGGEVMEVLSDGTHVVTASVTDSNGVTRSQEISVSVAPPPQPSAFIQVNPGTGLDASTFNSNSFVITNTGDADIESVSFDLSSAYLPDVVFDPNGTAGDAAGLCFTPGTGGFETGVVATAFPCSDPFSQPHNGNPDDGYEVMTITFTDFNPGETFAFSVDLDPTSIKNDVTTGDAGAISGFELIGSRVTVGFDGAGSLEGSLRDEGSLGGSATVIAENAPTSPSINVLGVATPAAVPTAAQTVQVTGPAGATVNLLQVDARLYIDSGAPGGGNDIDPFEANEAVAKSLYTATIGAGGTVDIPVTLLSTVPAAGPAAGLNHFIAWIEGTDVFGQTQTSLTSNTEVVELDPLAGVTELTLPVTQDSFTRGATPTSNHGTNSFMRVRGSNDIVSFASFDVSSLSGTVTSAILRLFLDEVPIPGVLQVHTVQGPWSEDTVTHNTRPPFGPAVTSLSIGAAQVGTTIEIDITSIVLGWQASPGTAYGVALTGDATLHTVFDTREATNAPEIEVTLAGSSNTNPVVEIDTPVNGAMVTEGEVVLFTGSATDAEEGDLTGSLSWTSNLDGPLGTSTNFSTTLSVGLHTITASVTDGGGLIGTDSVTVEVESVTGNTVPDVTISSPANGAIFTEGDSVLFTGTATDVEDGNITASLSWSSNLDGNLGTGSNFSVTTLSVGPHTITASVTDSGSLVGSDTVTITVNPLVTNTEPVVTITSPASGAVFTQGDTVVFTGTATDDLDGNLSGSLNWTSNLDGPLSSGDSFATTTLSLGIHTITASVMDSGGLIGSESVTVTVNAEGGGTELTLPVTQDSFTRGATPTSNHGTNSFMRVRGSNDIVSFASFDVSSLSGTVTSAVLRLFVDEVPIPGVLQVHTVQGPWSEDTVTHNTRPPFGPAVISQSIGAAQAGTTIEIDITSIVLGWQASPSTAYGVALTGDASLHTVFDTREGTNAPEIEVTLAGSTNTNPVVEIDTPVNGAMFTEGEVVLFTGSATDAEEGNLTGSLSWTSNLDGPLGTSTNFSTTLSVGLHTITAAVTDGGGLIGTDSVAVEVESITGNAVPEVTISSPANGAIFTEGDSVLFTGTAVDDEDGNITASLSWSSNVDGNFGSNTNFSISTLSVGPHTITASVTDSGSLVGSDTVTLTINPAGGTTETILPVTQDSFTRGATPTSNHGTNSFMRVRGSNDIVSFASFDVSSLSGTVTSAVLKLFVDEVPIPGTLQVHAVQGPWSEATVTHNTRPPFGPAVTSLSIGAPQVGTTIEIDITSIVLGWPASPSTAYGVALTGDASLHTVFDTREGTNAPEIEVNSSSGTPPAVN